MENLRIPLNSDPNLWYSYYTMNTVNTTESEVPQTVDRLGKSVYEALIECQTRGIDPRQELIGDLVCIVSDVNGSWGIGTEHKWMSVEAGTTTMLLEVSPLQRNQYGDSGPAKILHNEKVVEIYDTQKLYYLEHGDSLEGLSFCFTGKLRHVRDYYISLVKFQRGEFKKAVSKNVDYLVTGKDVGHTKLQKARTLGVKLLTEEALIKLMQENKAKNAKKVS